MSETSSMDRATIAVVMTCHNRKSITLSCLRTLSMCTLPPGVTYDLIVVDDGSTDGTADAIRAIEPRAEILGGSGTLFWNRGMHIAFRTALQRRYQFYLWLNDDTLLRQHALKSMFFAHAEARRRGINAIVVGSTCDPESGVLTYGGLVRRSRFTPLRLLPVDPGTEPIVCDTMNGNVVLIPESAAKAIGNLDWAFEHSMGDIDYGLRSRRSGVEIWLAPGFVGTCKRNHTSVSADAERSVVRRLRWTMGRKVVPVRSWAQLTRRHCGPLWPMFFLWPYLKACISLGSARANQDSP